MFTECEKWRQDFGVDEIARSFHFDENPMVTVYYPRYYHKTDKVPFTSPQDISVYLYILRTDDPCILSSWEKSILLQCTRSPPKNVSYKTLSTNMKSSLTRVWYYPFEGYIDLMDSLPVPGKRGN
jgi:hypothetical protein